MPIGISKSQSSDNRMLARDQGINVREGAYIDARTTTAASENARVASGRSTQANGGTAIGAGAKVNTGVTVGKGAQVESIVIGDGGEGVKALGKTLESSLNTISSQTDKFGESLKSALEALTDKQELDATGGTSSKNLTFLILGGLGLSLAAIYFLRK